MKFPIGNNTLFLSVYVNEIICVKMSRLVHRTNMMLSVKVNAQTNRHKQTAPILLPRLGHSMQSLCKKVQ